MGASNVLITWLPDLWSFVRVGMLLLQIRSIFSDAGGIATVGAIPVLLAVEALTTVFVASSAVDLPYVILIYGVLTIFYVYTSRQNRPVEFVRRLFYLHTLQIVPWALSLSVYHLSVASVVGDAWAYLRVAMILLQTRTIFMNVGSIATVGALPVSIFIEVGTTMIVAASPIHLHSILLIYGVLTIFLVYTKKQTRPHEFIHRLFYIQTLNILPWLGNHALNLLRVL